jgi:hypothetical protein
LTDTLMRKLTLAFQDSEKIFSVNLSSLTSSRDIDEQLLEKNIQWKVYLLTITVVNLQF